MVSKRQRKTDLQEENPLTLVSLVTQKQVTKPSSAHAAGCLVGVGKTEALGHCMGPRSVTVSVCTCFIVNTSLLNE